MVWFIILVAMMSCQKQSEKPHVKVFAHAGVSLFSERTVYPPNSLEAIKQAVEVMGGQAVEIDVQLTKDSVLVLFHDSYISNSPGFDGCIGNYNWSVLKDLKLEGSSYGIRRLEPVLDYLMSHNIFVYLDLKTYNFCTKENYSFSTISNQLDSIRKDYTDFEKGLIIAGSLNIGLLNTVNAVNKCFESSVDPCFGIGIAEENGYNYVLFPEHLINENESELLKKTPFKWGMFGGKANGEIRRTVALKPSFFISDNLVYTQKITQ